MIRRYKSGNPTRRIVFYKICQFFESFRGIKGSYKGCLYKILPVSRFALHLANNLNTWTVFYFLSYEFKLILLEKQYISKIRFHNSKRTVSCICFMKVLSPFYYSLYTDNQYHVKQLVSSVDSMTNQKLDFFRHGHRAFNFPLPAECNHITQCYQIITVRILIVLLMTRIIHSESAT